MADFIRVFESYYLYEVEIMHAKLASRGIQSFLKNNFTNNVTLMPVNQFYILFVEEKDAQAATEVIQEVDELDGTEENSQE